ncbi:MAG: polysaccharide pyruvyl transferase CsaB [Oscillospiraceae bacterium]|nr:polysaccharide pyruvyl transferase CsaB [Oscillospiraceae bacterium]
MKIIHLISGGDVGGAKTHVLSLLAGLRKTEDVRLVCFMEGGFAEEARQLGIDTQVLTCSFTAALKTLRTMINTEGFQLVHCHGSRANLMGTLLQSKIKAPVVTTVHSDYRLDYLGRTFHRFTYGLINAFCIRKIKYHIGVSDAMVDLLISRGLDPQSMFSIYNGVDFSPITPKLERKAYLESIGLSVQEDDIVFGIAARLSAVKDVATLIRGFGEACREVKNIKLVIAGDGEQHRELEKLAKQCCPEGSYVFAGWVSDMDSFYHALDVNTLTSLSETFPYALTEGARKHCATIASRVGGVPYLIEHGVTGMLFEAQDHKTLASHMVSLARNGQERQRLAENLYERACTCFSIDATVERQKEIYQVLLRRSSRLKARRDGVLICGAYGKGNAGDDSILDAILGQMRSIDPDIPAYVLSRNPSETRLRYRVGAYHTFDPRFILRMCRTKLYINGGGSLIQDVTSTRSLRYYLTNIALAKLCGNPVLMYGCGIGPVSLPKNRKKAGKVIDRYADTITLRDPQSAEELRAMGVTRPTIMITADPALLLDGAEETKVDGFMLSHGLDPKGHYALFVLRPWQGFDEVCPEIAKAARTLYETKGLTPVFLALEAGRDLPVSKQAAELVDCPHHVFCVPQDGKLIVGFMARMQVVVSMRLHALIFAAGQGTPLVGIVYDPKVSGFMDYLEQNNYVNLNDVTAQAILALAEQALSAGKDADSAKRLRALAEENEAAARALLNQ